MGTRARVLNRERPIRVVVAKVGLDGHEVGARVVARGLVEEGMEVIYTGLRRTPEQIAAITAQEDASVVGVSILSGAHMTLLPRVRECLDRGGMSDVLLIVGGIIPEADAAELAQAGIDAIFHPGTAMRDVADFIRSRVKTESWGGSDEPG